MRVRPRAGAVAAVVVAAAMALLAAGCGARFPDDAALQAGTGSGATASPDPGAATPADAVAAEGEADAAVGPASTGASGTGGGAAGSGGGAKAPAGTGAAPTVAGGAPAAGAVDPGPAPGVTDAVIKIGYLLPLTGAAPVPANFDRGANVYWDFIKKQGGLSIAGKKRNIELVIEDTGSDAQQGKDKARKLIETDKVFAIVVLDRLENQQAIGAFLDSRKVPNIQVQTPANLAKDQTWTFGITIDHGVQGGLIADYLVKTLGAKKLAVVAENTSVLDPGVNAFKAQAAKIGAEVVYSKKVQGDQTDFSGVALDLSQSGATATWLYMAPTTAAKLAVQADSAGYHPTWFANSISWNFNLALKAGGKAFVGARAFSPWPPLADPRTATYKQAYQAQYNETPDDLGIVGWGIGEVVGGSLAAVKGPLGQNSYREALQTLQLKPQLFNPLSFGPGVRQGGDQIAVYKAEMQGADLFWVLERDFTGSI